MLDLHCHILPGIDDGAKDLDESLKMCELARKDGINTIVATPHLNPGVYEPERELILAKVNELNRLNHVNLRILPGADNRVHPELIASIEKGQALTINDNMRYILLELPAHFLFHQIKDLIRGLKDKGITPIITHPERHVQIQRNLYLLYEFIKAGTLAQITAMGITGEFGLEIKRLSKRLLAHNLIQVIASDAHSSSKRPPILSRAVEEATRILGLNEATNMVTANPEAIIEGRAFEVPSPKMKKTFFQRIFS
jgi:protein-tyrosine phosphatase